jgi:hypothetical protein
MLLQAIKEGDDGTAIKKVDRRELTVLSPNSGSRPDTLEPETEAANRGEVGVPGPNTAPVGVSQGSEGGVAEPRVFHTEDFAARGPGGGDEVERDVVGGGTSRGSEGGIWQSKTPVLVDQGSVKASHNGRVLLVGPSELAVKERNLDKGEIINKLVE